MSFLGLKIFWQTCLIHPCTHIHISYILIINSLTHKLVQHPIHLIILLLTQTVTYLANTHLLLLSLTHQLSKPTQ